MFLRLHSDASIDLTGLQNGVQVLGKKISFKPPHLWAYPLLAIRIVIPKMLV
jgi:hypothetical protein